VGRLPYAADEPALTVEPGMEVTFDTVSHEGVLQEQGRDPKRFFGEHDVADVLDDAVALAASDVPHAFGVDGPHVVSRPVRVAGAPPGDLLAMAVLETLPRLPYGVISNRHGRGALPGEYPREGCSAPSPASTRPARTAGCR
jgi:acetamidase/formamidase